MSVIHLALKPANIKLKAPSKCLGNKNLNILAWKILYFISSNMEKTLQKRNKYVSQGFQFPSIGIYANASEIKCTLIYVTNYFSAVLSQISYER